MQDWNSHLIDLRNHGESGHHQQMTYMVCNIYIYIYKYIYRI